ncbi:DUF6293 family protein [Nitrosopumilus sp.]|uniref:HFX_2341 family transcriptional regulator domain-containing protein n=1 Tax=Nitrosopumilus sp. TaxID=2024843 RepID=UPI0026380B59|nr:DUF6293 family protein [Nitrosopumilus sp.]
MAKLTNLRVHIAPVGYEIDRIVLPAKKMKADKVCLLVHENPSIDKAITFYEKISKQLQKQNIEVVREYHDRLDLFKIIKSVKEIIEKEKGNIIYVNLAAGSKIQAIACMMACMMFNDEKNIHPFYVEAKDYLVFSGKAISTGIKDIQDVPTYEIKRPDKKHIDALRIISEKGGRISKKEMARLAKEEKLIVVNAENQSQATFASLDKNIINTLENQWKFIKVEKIGRTRWINITEDGKNAAEFLI